MQTTRSAAALELWRPHLDGAIVAIGNAPTALFHLLNMLEDDDCPRPAAIIGCPVGFVGAAESKAALMASPPAPALTRRGPSRRLRDHGRGRECTRKQERMRMGRIICCGLGPGDPDLISVRADREVRAATHVAYFRKKGRPGQARAIVEGMLRAGRARISDGISGHDRACLRQRGICAAARGFPRRMGRSPRSSLRARPMSSCSAKAIPSSTAPSCISIRGCRAAPRSR